MKLTPVWDVVVGPLLETKFRVPRHRRDGVARPRLNERLSHGAESTLTLVSAPAGFGKTTLLAEWLQTRATDGRPAAWLSIDQRDNDSTSFWSYLITAVDAVAQGVGAGALTLLQSSQPPVQAVLGALLNDLDALQGDLVLVLDDYHLIDARDVQDGMTFMLEHLPPQIHLVIAGRADPTLPLARLRARGELVEIRAADLRFTSDEAAAYLNGVMGLTLTANDVEALEKRTEGWIAALQLAALSMQGRNDVSSFIAGFAGDDRYIVDYLAEEVLNRQPDNVRHFLMQTSVLDRLSGPLCDAVTGQPGGKATLTALERGNLFLVPLDDRREWYRYHQLFADVLRARLLDEQPEIIPDLHGRASDWFEQAGQPSEAIHHAFSAKDFERAADLVERAIPAMRRTRQEATMRGWLRLLPADVVRRRPVLSVGSAGALLAGGEVDGVEMLLRQAERLMDESVGIGEDLLSPVKKVVVVDADEFNRLPQVIELYRAALALARGDVPATERHAGRAIELAPEGEHLGLAAARGLLGLTFWASGDLQAGYSYYAECMAGLRRAGHIADTFGCAIALADILITQGHLGQAMLTYEQALHLAPEQNGSLLRGTADMHVGMSELNLERNDLPAARQNLLRCQELGEHLGLPQNPYRRRVALARIREAEGDLAGAHDLLDEAERLYVGDFFPNVRPVPALRARLILAQGGLNEGGLNEGGLNEALAWVRERGLSVDDDLNYLFEFEHITLARVLLARKTARGAPDSADDAVRLLDRLLHAAEQGERTGSVIEILVLQALTHQASGPGAAALTALRRALELAEPEGYVRVFLSEGPAMNALLKAAEQPVNSAYVRRLLEAAERTDRGRPTTQGPSRHSNGAMVEALTERELDVLRLLATDLDGPDIARRLFVSLNTVRTHTKNIYTKLGVGNRRAAVRRAQELGLL